MNLLAPHTERIATVLFLLALIHTFSVKRFKALAENYKEGSFLENLFHVLGEVELVFALWSIVFLAVLLVVEGLDVPGIYIENLSFTEPLFVFAIIVVSASRPIISLTSLLIKKIANLIPFHAMKSSFFITLFVGPLLGSVITEPAAMTVTAMLLKKLIYDQKPSRKLAYMTLGVLFVNVSIGGMLTPFAAPPVLMVAKTWGWDTSYMLTHFGWQATLSVFLNTLIVLIACQKDLNELALPKNEKTAYSLPWWMYLCHLLVLVGIVTTSHHPAIFLGIFLVFVGFAQATKEYQDALKFKEGMLVGLFLGGLVVLGKSQSWWLELFFENVSHFTLYLGATGLTAVVDNAMITYLGSQVSGLSTEMQHALVAGAVTGGGLTIVANAPNPAGFSILQDSFGEEGISPIGLLINALGPTLVPFLLFWFYP